MPEYFDISFIAPKTNSSKSEMESFLKRIGLSEGENLTELFSGRQIIAIIIDDDKTDFEELSIGLAEQIFHKENFEKEVGELTFFINQCFEYYPNLKYALCSYELNGYLLRGIKKLKDINNNDLLKCFPFVYEKKYVLNPPLLQINEEAQDLFVLSRNRFTER
jgi:hypothetical protein